MNWLNIELSTLRSTEYLGSDPTQRATWLNLMAYCADQENGGVVADCADWGSRRWLQLIGVTKEEVLNDSALWSWKGSSINVWMYPKAKEAEVRAKRIAGRKGGRPPKVNESKDDKPDGLPIVEPDGSVLLKRKGKEGKGIGKEVEGKDTTKSPNLFIAPTEIEACDWAKAWAGKKNKNPSKAITVCREAWKYYERLDWHDNRGKKVKDWKRKITAVWFTDDKLGVAAPINIEVY